MSLNFVEWHDLSSIHHQEKLNKSLAQGFRSISLCVYGERQSPLYAAVMVKRPQLIAQQQFFDLNAAQFQQRFNEMAAQGFGPVIVTATGPANDPLIAAVFCQMKPIPRTRVGITADELRQLNLQALSEGLILKSADAYGTPGDTRYIAVWHPNTDNVAWNCDTVNDDGDTTQKRFNAFASAWARPVHLTPTSSQGFLEVFADSVVTGGWASRAGMTVAGYQAELDNFVKIGFAPVCVAAQGSGDNRRFTAIFAPREDTEPRTFRPQGAVTVDEIDAAVKAVMQANQLRGAALAIVKDTKLVYAKGYTWAEASYPDVQPTTLFRQASVGKTFIAVAIYQLIHEGKLTLNTTLQSVLQLKTPDGKQPVDPKFGEITIRHLLEMTAGVDSGLIWRDVEATQAFHAPLPVTPAQLASYCASQKLAGTPGDKALSTYSNGGYFLLSQVVAKLRGASSFAEAINGALLHPLGISRIRQAHSLVGSQATGEARYHPRPLATGISRMTPDMPLITLGYGETNHETSGGLSAAVTDVARLLAALSLRENNPILDEKTITNMLSNAAAASADPKLNKKGWGFHGFDSMATIDAAKGLYRGYKGGELSTSQNSIIFERGRLSYVICWNGKTTQGEVWYPHFQSVEKAASKHDWGNADLFPQFGMPSFPAASKPSNPPFDLHFQPVPETRMGHVVRPV